ncbi:MAG: cyclic pyranopterin monophosphate synthase MoaC [Candidatus Aceula meridiana]|nr:cyclic pyranopterin monophosphate synthase MoaC [Candidatus Aceula meridiana]
MNLEKKKIDGMVDISSKKVTKRIARACCEISFKSSAFEKLVKGKSPKGDVLECARIAGVMAAKKTPDIIPMCHPLSLSKVAISFEINNVKKKVVILSEVSCQGKTGVEMEALTAASVAALTIYDMMKWADKTMIVSDLKLLYKSGGKSGIFRRKSK